MNKNFINGVIKSVPKKWTNEDIATLLSMRQNNIKFKDIATKLQRTHVSVEIKYKRLCKKNDTYNIKDKNLKYNTNADFIKSINPQSILDVYAGGSYYKNNYKDIKVIDNDIKGGCDYKLKSMDLLTKLRSKKYDLIDLDPYGSAFECFDLAINMSLKGLIITFGEYGHQRWNRSDFVRHRYNINTLGEFRDTKFIDYIINRGLIFNKDISVYKSIIYKNILRVYFNVKTIKKSQSGKEYFKSNQIKLL